MPSPLQNLFGSLSGEWQLNLETQVPRNDLYKSRIASSRPTLGFFFAADLFSSDCNARIDFQQHGGRDRRHDRCPIDGSNPEPCLWPRHF